MPSYTQPPCLLEDVRVEYCHRTAPDPGILACEAPAVYRPRHPEATVFYQTFEQHFDSYVRAYEDRFEPRRQFLAMISNEGWGGRIFQRAVYGTCFPPPNPFHCPTSFSPPLASRDFALR